MIDVIMRGCYRWATNLLQHHWIMLFNMFTRHKLKCTFTRRFACNYEPIILFFLGIITRSAPVNVWCKLLARESGERNCTQITDRKGNSDKSLTLCLSLRAPCWLARVAAGTGDWQVVKMLVVVVASFATLWLPYRAYVVYNSFARRRYKNRWFLLCCRLAVYINSAINPLLYNAMSTKFRLAFTSLLCRRSGNIFFVTCCV